MNWKDGVSWSVAIIFLLWSLTLASGALLAGIISLSVGLFFVPKVRRQLVERFDLEITKTTFMLVIVLGAFSAGALSPSEPASQPAYYGSPPTPQSTSNPSTPSGNVVGAAEYQALQGENSNLRNNNKQLRKQNQELREQNQQFRGELRNSVSPPYVIAEDRAFRATFETQSGDPVSYNINSEIVESQILTGTYMRQMSYDQLEYLELDSISSRFEGESKYRQLGDQGRYYQLKPFVVEENFQKISEDIYNRYDTDEARVREVWHFTTQMHSYSAEIEETPRMPTETLVMGGGDCEDTAILAASMLKAMPEDWTVEFVYMDADQPTNPQNVDHVLIYVDTGEYQTFIETTSSTTMSPYSGIDGYYVEV